MALAGRLLQTIVHVLERDGVGARVLRLSLYRVDGDVKTIDIALTLPTRSISHVTRLIDLKLGAIAATLDAGFGFEAIGLAVTHAEPMPARQTALNIDPHLEVRAQRASNGGNEVRWPPQDQNGMERCAILIDALRQRLGPYSVHQFEFVESHIPEYAEVLTAVTGSSSPALRRMKSGADETRFRSEPEQARPLLLLPHAEPAEEVTALVPEGPPRRFRWRGVTYDVKGAQGPERISAEWWRMRQVPAHSSESENPALQQGETREAGLRIEEPI